jgi:ketosteroid isomerase-like protein
MSERNLEVAKTLYAGPLDLAEVFATPEALEAGRAQLEPLFQPDFETVHDPKAVGLAIGGAGGVSKGVDGFIAIWRDFLGAWDSWVVTPVDFVDLGDDRVLVLANYRGRSKTHGAEMTLDGGAVLSFSDGRVARLELFFNRQDALEAAGVPE